MTRLLAMLFALSAMAASAPDDSVAFVDKVYSAQGEVKTPHLSDILVVERGDRPLPASEVRNLRAHDKIFVLDPDDTVTVRILSTWRAIPVRQTGADRRKPDLVVEAPTAGLPETLVEMFRAVFSGSDQSPGRKDLQSRDVGPCFNTSGQTNLPIRFDAPVLESRRSFLAAGNRPLWVGWRGGVPPFKVELSDALSDRILARAAGRPGVCAAMLDPVVISPDRQYRLTIVDGNGLRAEETEIYGASRAPDMPASLRDLRLPAADRSLYYATWLRSQDEAAWTFEAAQVIAGLGCSNTAVREWFEAVQGGSGAC
jgi:hypothetical protein